MSEFIQGPLWSFASTVFLIGVIWRIGVILTCKASQELSQTRGSATAGSFKAILRRSIPRKESVNTSRFQIVAGYMFHLGLFAVLFLAAPHVEFLKQQFLGFGWTPMPHWGFIVTAEFAFAGLILLWLRRMMHPVTRLLSTIDDHLSAGLTFVAMFTGCLALFESFNELRVLHLFTVEILLIYFPFSNLMHAFTFAASRSATGARAGSHGV